MTPSKVSQVFFVLAVHLGERSIRIPRHRGGRPEPRSARNRASIVCEPWHSFWVAILLKVDTVGIGGTLRARVQGSSEDTKSMEKATDRTGAGFTNGLADGAEHEGDSLHRAILLVQAIKTG